MAEERVRVTVGGTFKIEDGSDVNFLVTLRDGAGRRIQIFLGQFEAWAIAAGLEGQMHDRPLTHEAMLLLLATTGAAIQEVYINDLREETFYAVMSLRTSAQTHQIDMRPSDALSLAVRVKCPIYVSNEIFEICLQHDKQNPAIVTPVRRPMPATFEVSEELAQMYAEDQSDRTAEPLDWNVIGPRDAARLARVKELYQSGGLDTGMDYYHAAMILQHASDPDDHLLAHELCVVAITKGIEPAKWLAAASEDRFLMNIGRPQRFGTQFRSDGPDADWHLYEVSPAMTDTVRRALNVPPLSEAQARAAQMNAKPE